MKDKIKSYGFWTAFAGALVVLLNALGEIFGFAFSDKKVTALVMAIAGVLVVFGVVNMPDDPTDKDSQEDNSKDIDKNSSQGG